MNSSGYGGQSQRQPTQQQTYEAPACVQNAMMTKDKKPFTYTPGGIDLSQIKSERMAKRLARNAQAEGATGASQMNRPTQPLSPNGSTPVAASMGAAAMGMPFQVFPTGPPAAPQPPPPPPSQSAGKQNGSIGAPPPPPPPSSSNNTTLATPNNTKNGSTLTAPSSPNTARKSPTPQRFEPPPMGFRPEIKIPPNPMATLKKVAPPVEKNNFWVEEYRKERSKSPMVGDNDSNRQNDSIGSHEYNNRNNTNNSNSNNEDYKQSFTPTMTTSPQQPPSNSYSNKNNNTNDNNSNYHQYSPNAQQQSYSPPAPQQQQQQSSQRPEFRSVAPPQSPSVNVYTQPQNNSSPLAQQQQQQQQQRASESPFRFAQQQTRPMPPMSPLAQQQPQQQQPPSASIQAPPQQQQQQTAQSSAVPWRTQRSPQPPQTYQQQQQQPTPPQQQHPQPIYNNVRSRDTFSPAPETAAPYQGPKPTNVGSLYIAPLAPTVEPQAQHIVRQQMQLQAQRDSPMRQVPQQQQQQQQQQQPQRQQPLTARWMTSQPTQKEQPAWARAEENGNVMPSSLQRMKSPEPMQQHQQQQQRYQPAQGNGFANSAPTASQNYGAHNSAPTGLRLQINVASSNQSAPKERIIPIQLEQTPTPTHTPSQQPSFGTQGGNTAPSGYVMRSPNQFVDQGYNNYSATPQQTTAPRAIQQQHVQQTNFNSTTNNVGGVRTRIIPIALEGDGTRGPISQSPVIIQNDQRTTPVQSKSFRILQKITDTIDDGDERKIAVEAKSAPIECSTNAEPQLQRPQFARQMSAQQARNSPTIEQMRRLQIAQEQLPVINQGNSTDSNQLSNKFVHQSIFNNEDKPQPYVHPSEQQVPEPKKYSGSAIPSRSFKILQAMTTPENAAEMEDSDSFVVELNDKTKNNSIASNNSQNPNHTTISNVNSNCQNCSLTNTTPNPTPPPPSSSSTSSINSEHGSSIHSASHPFHPYATPYSYPWCPPMPPPPPPGNDQLPPNWSYPFPVPPLPLQGNCDSATNWHYPYPMPPQIPQKHPSDNTAHPHYPPYPYYYPFYPPPPPPPLPHMIHHPPQTSSSASSIENDSQNAFDLRSYPYHPGYPYPSYHPYPIITTNSQSSNPSSSASSVLPDIIVTPSNDDGPAEIMYQHKIKVEKREPSSEYSNSIKIAEVSTTKEPINREQREGSVIDMLTKHLNEMKNLNENTKSIVPEESDKREKTVAELRQEFDKKSILNNPKKPIIVPTALDDEVESSSSELSEESSESCESLGEDDDDTTKDDIRKPNELKAIKSVTNVQMYKGKERKQEHSEESCDDDDEDVTSADGESDIFDEEDEENEESNTGDGLELDECIEENDDDDLLEPDYLSVIYEEESEVEKSGDTRIAYHNEISSNSSEATTIDNKNFDHEIEENDDDSDEMNEKDNDDGLGENDLKRNGEEETGEDSNSVTVRLPLKFSFSRSSNDEKIATVEVGNSQIEERRNSISIEDKHSTFSVAKLSIDDEEEQLGDEYEDDCDVSVTISLTPSSRSASFDKTSESRFICNMDPLNESSKLLKETELSVDKSSSDDVSVSFSLNMRNKFMDQTINGETTNDIASIGKSGKEIPTVKVRTEPVEELDFFAMLKATKMQAQQMKEHSASYWGKSSEKSTEDKDKLQDLVTEEASTSCTEKGSIQETETKTEIENIEEEDEIEDIWASREDDDPPPRKIAMKPHILEPTTKSIFSIVQETAKVHNEIEPVEQVEPLEGDFWAVVEQSKAQEQTQIVKENVKFVQCCTTVLKSREEVLIRPSQGDLTVLVEKEIPQEKTKSNPEKKIKSGKKKTDKETKITTRKKKKADKIDESKLRNEEIDENTTVQEDFQADLQKIPVGEKQEISTFQEDCMLTTKTKEQKVEVEILHESSTIQEDYRPTVKSKDTDFEIMRESTKFHQDNWTISLIKTETQKMQVEQVREGTEDTDDLLSPSKHKPKNTPVIFPSLDLESQQKIEIGSCLETTCPIQTEEAEQDFWADIEKSKSASRVCDSLYDPEQYPEEPREVDTEEEIDFWAEIEAKKNQSNDDITFHKAANFWANRDRQNSVEETPYKPLTKTPFHARLPDEPSVNMNAWIEALEKAKGEEPEIIDPVVEEEKQLAVEFNNLEELVEEHQFEEEKRLIPKERTLEVYTDTQKVDQSQDVETDFLTTTRNESTFNGESSIKEDGTVWKDNTLENETTVPSTTTAIDDNDDLEVKRNNYRKAMAFFTTSIDENKEKKPTRGSSERKSIKRNKAMETENFHEDEKTIQKSLSEDNKMNPVEIERHNFNTVVPNEVSTIQEAKENIEKQTIYPNTTPTNSIPKFHANFTQQIDIGYETFSQINSSTDGAPETTPSKASEEQKPSVRERINAFENGAVESPSGTRKPDVKMQSLSVESHSPKSSNSRNSGSQRSESEQEEEDSGVTDMNKQLSETDTESESFPELRKMTSYQRAATHSRLFKLLQDENDDEAEKSTQNSEEQQLMDEFQFKPSRRKIVHNVSITRRQNPSAIQHAESMSERRERLSLPLRQKNSIDADNPSTPNSPASPILGQPNSRVVSDKLVNELVQSLLLKRDSSHLRTLPMEKLQAAAKRVLEEELDSLENTSVETTPAPTPNTAKVVDRSYADYYDSWSDATGMADIVPSKAFRALQDRPKRSSPWSVKCPRVLSSKTINRDLTRVTESPEIVSRASKSPERLVRESPVSRWKKV